VIDIIICTYNRPKKIIELVHSLLPHKADFNRIIVVDSSDKANGALEEIVDVFYLRSNQKNQPYQRYLGFINASSDFLLYLDDDMELVNKEVFSRINQYIKDYKDLSGIALNFKDKHSNSTLSEVPKSVLFKKAGLVKRIIRWITAIPELSQGELGFCGNRGAQPTQGGRTHWLSGGAFLAKKSALFQNFNFQMIDIFIFSYELIIFF
jgi:glycosyltransferase involved in cell wall biosynthesis